MNASELCSVSLEFDVLLDVCSRLTAEGPVEDLLTELLLQARRLTRAEAGAVYVVEAGMLRWVCVQNDARPEFNAIERLDRLKLGAGKVWGKGLPMDDSSIAGSVAGRREPLRFDDVYAMPPGARATFDDSFDRRSGYRTRSMLVVPIDDAGHGVVGVLQLINKKGATAEDEVFTDRDQQVAAGLASLAAISVRNAQMREELGRQHLDTILRLATAAEFRDNETSQHIRRVSLYCESVSRALGQPQDWSQLMMFASPMHDIGKLGVPDAILQKPGKLTPEERAVMQQHTTIGARILAGSRNDLLQLAESIALTHHEKWDGTGYPRGLKGSAIPLEGRVLAVADVFDALTSKRVYKAAFDMDASFEQVVKGRGTHFDPEVVDAFVRARGEVEAIHEAYSGEEPGGPLRDLDEHA